jgi:branched-chain amino acid transport system substrate-binding protein
MQDVAMDYHKVFISTGAALPELCDRVVRNYDRYKYYFRNGVVNSSYLAKVSFLQLDFVARSLRKTLGIDKIKVAVVAEKAGWVEGMVTAAVKKFPLMGLDLAGVYYLSTVASDVTSSIKAIGKTKAPLVFTLFSSHVGETFVTQAANRRLPALQVGINVEAQKNDFWETTGGRADYVITAMPFCRGVEITKLTEPFLEKYIKRFGTIPSFTSGTYATILHSMVPAIEQAGTLDPDIFVSVLENRRYETPQGFFEYEKDPLGRHRHDPKFGINDAIILGGQWRNGEMRGVWPNKFHLKPAIIVA